MTKRVYKVIKITVGENIDFLRSHDERFSTRPFDSGQFDYINECTLMSYKNRRRQNKPSLVKDNTQPERKSNEKVLRNDIAYNKPIENSICTWM